MLRSFRPARTLDRRGSAPRTAPWTALLFAAAIAIASAPAFAGSRGLLWEAQPPGADAPRLWLLGTLHLGTAAMYPFSDAVEQALDTATTVAVEADPGDAVAAQAALVGGLHDPGDSLAAHVPAPLYQATVDAFALRGVPEGGARMMRPFLAAMTLSVLELTAHGFDPARGVDSVVVQRARAAGHRVVELESLSMQVALFADLSPATQTALLDATLRGLDDRSMLRDARQLHDAWRDGDAAALTATLADEWARMPADAARELQQRLVDARNDRMLARVTALHAAGAGDVLVAIGAAHLVGDTGLVEQLRRRGWRVTQR